eukprot:3324390-Pyramimonas_sp.AAC.1
MADAALRLADGAQPLGGGRQSRLASGNPAAPFAKTSAGEALRTKLARKKEDSAEAPEGKRQKAQAPISEPPPPSGGSAMV